MGLLQTTPYFSVVSQHEEGKEIIRYSDGKKIWLSNLKDGLLRDCLKAKEKNEILRAYPSSLLEECIREQLICDVEEIYSIHQYTWVDIETTTACNYECVYCPVRYHRRAPAVMGMELFDRTVSQLEEDSSVEYVSLSSYNEPTMDPYFEQRVARLFSSRLKLNLYTNGSNLSAERISMLGKGRDVVVIINIPGLDADYYEEITGGGDIRPVIQNLEECIRSNLDVRLVVNGYGEDVLRQADKLRKRYQNDIAYLILPNYMTDRCGSLPHDGNQHIYIEGDLYGCDKVLNTLSIAADGMVFLCCNDYFHKTALGNLQHDTLINIVNGDEAKRHRSYIFGEPGAASDYICRYCIYMKISKRSEKKRYRRVPEKIV